MRQPRPLPPLLLRARSGDAFASPGWGGCTQSSSGLTGRGMGVPFKPTQRALSARGEDAGRDRMLSAPWLAPRTGNGRWDLAFHNPSLKAGCASLRMAIRPRAGSL